MLGEVDAARELDQETLERRRRVLGEDHPDALYSAYNLAADLRELGEIAAARELDQDTLERRRRVLGEDHPDTLYSAYNLAADCASWVRSRLRVTWTRTPWSGAAASWAKTTQIPSALRIASPPPCANWARQRTARQRWTVCARCPSRTGVTIVGDVHAVDPFLVRVLATPSQAGDADQLLARRAPGPLLPGHRRDRRSNGCTGTRVGRFAGMTISDAGQYAAAAGLVERSAAAYVSGVPEGPGGRRFLRPALASPGGWPRGPGQAGGRTAGTDDAGAAPARDGRGGPAQ